MHSRKEDGMALYLNTDSSYEDFKMLVNGDYFVDKSGIIEKINKRINTKNRYLCITKPRRFGKKSVLNMLGSYYGAANDSKELFDGLEISRCAGYEEHLNKYHVIHMNLNSIPVNGSSYGDYLGRMNRLLTEDLKEAYPEWKEKEFQNVSDLLSVTGDKFIFIMDEWDYIFSHDLYPEHQGDFLEYLRDLLKDRPYVALAYMTGVLPVKRYSTGSALNMFDEYTMLNDSVFGEYFGFTEKEVETLCGKQSEVPLEDIRVWYNGYYTKKGVKIYNPRSVVLALINGDCQNYWTRTGRMDEVLFFLKYNIGEVREDAVKMVNHMPVRMEIRKEYTAGQGKPENREEIYAAMIIYGLLSYHDGEIRIPNRELMLEFESALKDGDFGYVAELVKNSGAVLDATLNGDGDSVASYLHNIHNSEIPLLKYNDENSLSCVVTLAYLSARDKYNIEREEKSGKGYADFLFYPKRKNMPGIILELKADRSPEAAIRQIREKEYGEKLRKENISDILAVGIGYDTGKKEHRCRIEKL